MLTDYEAAIAIVAVSAMVVPSMMPTAIVFVEAHAGTVISVAVISRVAADIDADASRVGEGWSAECKRRCRCKSVSELSHVFLLRFHPAPTAGGNAGCRNWQETFLNRRSATLVIFRKARPVPIVNMPRAAIGRVGRNADGSVNI
jgi:hypothetical protein